MEEYKEELKEKIFETLKTMNQIHSVNYCGVDKILAFGYPLSVLRKANKEETIEMLGTFLKDQTVSKPDLPNTGYKSVLEKPVEEKPAKETGVQLYQESCIFKDPSVFNHVETVSKLDLPGRILLLVCNAREYSLKKGDGKCMFLDCAIIAQTEFSADPDQYDHVIQYADYTKEGVFNGLRPTKG